MTDDYLWDRSGDPDPEVVRLERLLGSLGHRTGPAPAVTGRALPAPGWRRFGVPLALAASMVLLVGQVWFSPRVTANSWVIESRSGTDGDGNPAPGMMTIGRWLQTDSRGRATLRASNIGTVNVGPDSRVRVVTAGPGRHVLELEHGSLTADVSAAPGVFVVETAAARAIDLGCRYVIDVDHTGAGRLHVTLGWVGLTFKGRDSLVPAGALCATRAGAGPGTPYFEGATPAFVNALAVIDSGSEPGLATALTALLAEARPLDAITLWHLLARLDAASASREYDTLVTLAPPSARVTRERVLAGDPMALAAWWEDIGLGDIGDLRRGMVRMR